MSSALTSRKHFLIFRGCFKCPPVLFLLAASSDSDSRVQIAVGCNQCLFRSQSLPTSPGSWDSQSLMLTWRCISAIPGSLQSLNIHFQASLPLYVLFLLPRMPSSTSLLHLTYSCFKVYLQCHVFKEVSLKLLAWVSSCMVCPCLGFHQKCGLRQRHMHR